MVNDIVSRLRDYSDPGCLYLEAADEIERLRRVESGYAEEVKNLKSVQDRLWKRECDNKEEIEKLRSENFKLLQTMSQECEPYEILQENERLKEEVKLLNACIYSDQAAAECRTIL